MAHVADGDEARALMAQRNDLSANEQRDIEAQSREVDADNRRAGERAVIETREGLGRMYDDLSAEIIEVSEGFQTVASLAGRPDVDPAEVAQVYSDLHKRAKVVNARLASWDEQLSEYQVRKSDPAAYIAGLRRKWAEKAITQSDRFLHHINGL